MIKEFLARRLYWFLTRGAPVKIVVVAGIGGALLACYITFFLVVSDANSTDRASRLEGGANTPIASERLPPTYTPPSAPPDRDLEIRMSVALSEYEYELEQLLVQEVINDGDELVVHLRRQGSPSQEDYFGQLDVILDVIATKRPDVDRVRTLDVEARSGFVVEMGDLLEFHQAALEYDQYRARWQPFPQ